MSASEKEQLVRRLCYERLVFCYQNCSDLLWEKKCSSDGEKLLKFEAEGREVSKIVRTLTSVP